ncbi:MAG: CRISPR-associated RAMP protein [Blastocatellia bacterium]|nr:CRISPR-associated RAMP protein [Blastocatellia bacterium]
MPTGAKLHNKLDRRLKIFGQVRTETALHIGSGGSIDVTEPDSPVVRDVNGLPYIPGSSFRGVLRSTLETFLSSLADDTNTLRVDDIFDSDFVRRTNSVRDKHLEDFRRGNITAQKFAENIYHSACTVGKIFGTNFYASRVKIKDLRLLNPEEITLDVRNGVGIDRDKETAAKGILYTFECVPAGARFEFELVFDNPEDWEIGLILAGLKQFDEGFAHLGGKASRGLGRVRVMVQGIEVKTARNLLLDEPGETFGLTQKPVVSEPVPMVKPKDPIREKAAGAGAFWVDVLELARERQSLDASSLYDAVVSKGWNKEKVQSETGKEWKATKILEQAVKFGLLNQRAATFYPVELVVEKPQSAAETKPESVVESNPIHDFTRKHLLTLGKFLDGAASSQD